MLSCLWHASLIFASLWGPGDFIDTVIPQLFPNDTEKGALGGTAVGTGSGPLAGSENPSAIVVGGALGATVGGSVGATQDRREERKAATEEQLKKNAPGVPKCDSPPATGQRTEHGPPILSQIPYVNRLFRSVGYPRDDDFRFERIGVDFNQYPPTVTNTQTEAPGPMPCPAGGKAAPKIVAKAERAQQIHFDVTVFELNRTALPNFKFRWAENQSGPAAFGALADVDGLSDTLAVLREAGLMKILVQPRVATVSGGRATFASGGQVAITSPGPNPTVSYKLVGITFELLPTLKANGKMQLEVRYEITSLNGSKDITIPGVTPITVPGFDTQCIHVGAVLEPGKTLAIGGLVQNHTARMISRVPVLADLPGVGDLFTWTQLQETKQEIVILITPHIVKRHGDASETSEPPVAALAKAERGNRLNLDDVIALSKRGLSPRIIVRQMELTNANFDLTVDDLIRLAENGVDEDIISAMQERR